MDPSSWFFSVYGLRYNILYIILGKSQETHGSNFQGHDNFTILIFTMK